MKLHSISLSRLILVAGIIILLYLNSISFVAIAETIQPTEAIAADGVIDSFYGETVSGIGDYNKDGYDDIIVGGRQYQDWRGNTWIYFGSKTGISSIADFQIIGEPNKLDSGICMGHATANLGDLNLDGNDDFAAGGPGSWGGWDVGKVYIFFGGVSGSVFPAKAATDANITLVSPITYDWFGEAMSPAGDFNNDGYPDLLVGAPGSESEEEGTVPYSNGKAYIFFGNNEGYSASPEITLNDYGDHSAFGLFVGGNGDLNNDNFDDVVVSAPWNNSRIGAVYVFSGREHPASNPPYVLALSGNSNMTEFGRHVEILKDLNNDGYDDLGISGKIMVDGSLQPAINIYFGRQNISEITEPDLVLSSLQPADDFGLYFRQIPDMNNDTYPELAIGAPGLQPPPTGSTYPGMVYIYHGGPDIDSEPDTIYAGEKTGDYFGYSIATADVDGDAKPDLIIGATGYDTTGRIYVYLSGNGIADIGISLLVIVALTASIIVIVIMSVKLKPKLASNLHRIVKGVSASI
jgi:hypothetical protein